MKRLLLLLMATAIWFAGDAQAKTNATRAASATPKIIPTTTPTSFETNLAQGKINLTKAFKKTDGSQFLVVYSISYATARAANNRKSMEIKLDQTSFDAIFSAPSSEMSGKTGQLNKYILDHKISLTEEKGWTDLINYYNGL